MLFKNFISLLFFIIFILFLLNIFNELRSISSFHNKKQIRLKENKLLSIPLSKSNKSYLVNIYYDKRINSLRLITIYNEKNNYKPLCYLIFNSKKLNCNEKYKRLSRGTKLYYHILIKIKHSNYPTNLF